MEHKLKITFEGDWWAVRAQMYDVLGLDHPAQASTAPNPTTLAQIFDEEEAKKPEPDPAPAQTPLAPAPAPKRSHKKAPPPPPPVSAAPAPEPEADEHPAFTPPDPVPEYVDSIEEPVALPPLDALKSIVTSAVREAQKNKKGKILDLLPDFKEATGLDFVMHAEDKHRKALYDLIQNAGLEVV